MNPIEQLIFDTFIKVATAALVSALPFLGWPGISLALSLVLNYIGGIIFSAISKIIDFTVIDFKEDAKNEKYKEALDALKKAQASGDQSAIDKAAADYRAKLHDLIVLH